MEVKRRIIIKHVDGTPVNLRYKPVDSLFSAARFPTMEDYETFINGFYKPIDGTKFIPQEVEITIREVSSSEPLPEDS